MATTGPSHATMFTSLYPRTHGFVKNGLVLSEHVTTLAEVVSSDGYQTAAVVGSFPVKARFGFGQGFETYDDDFEADGRTIAPSTWEGHSVEEVFDRDARLVTRNAIRWLQARSGEQHPFFLWTHYYDPHYPYQPPPEYRGLFMPREGPGFRDGSLEQTIALYDAEIRETDDSVGTLLEALQQLDLDQSTLLVIAGDHGEGLMQHGHMFHGLHIYEEGVHVPLLFRFPGVIPAHVTISEPVQLLDLLPTILDLARLPRETVRCQGTSLAAAITSSEPLDPERAIFLQRRHYESRQVGEFHPVGEQLAVRKGAWKYLQAPDEGSYELYNLEDDPGETTNRYTERPRVAGSMATTLRNWRDTIPEASTPFNSISEDDTERLRQLGYVE